MSSPEWVENKLCSEESTPVRCADVLDALSFWRGAPFYAETPLVPLPGAAKALGIGGLYLKDESRRFGLGAFKVMGAGYAMARALGARSWAEAANSAQRRTFYTATDGNHGRAVAWCARRLRQRAVVLMPKGSAEARRQAIAAEGAEVHVTEFNYDDSVRMARDLACADENGLLLQDTTLPGYADVPLDIMRGYSAIAAEAAERLPAPPTHVILQAGVGSFAGGTASALTSLYPHARPTFLVAETAAAPCLMRSAASGCVCTVPGEIDTIMAGLACGEPCTLGLEALLSRARFFAALPDECASDAMRALAMPEPGDEAVTAGESGAAGYALLRAVMLSPELAPLRAAAGLNEHSRVLVFNTEGATDPENYARIVGNFAGHPPSKDV